MKKYWKSLEQIDGKTLSVAEPEFSTDGIPEEEIETKNFTSRRDFLKILGFGVGYATLAASCEMPVNKAIPFLNKPKDITPGVANYYASTFFDGHDFCNILVKTREGRPIKIEGNDLSYYTKGGTTARVQASVLNLYDSARFQGPLKDGASASWDEVDKEVAKGLEEFTSSGQKIIIFDKNFYNFVNFIHLIMIEFGKELNFLLYFP